MSDTTIAIAVVPFLAVLTLALEGTRIGCTRLRRFYRAARSNENESRERNRASGETA